MVDLTPRALLNRLDRGVVYAPDKAQQALGALLQGVHAGRAAGIGAAAGGARSGDSPVGFGGASSAGESRRQFSRPS